MEKGCTDNNWNVSDIESHAGQICSYRNLIEFRTDQNKSREKKQRLLMIQGFEIFKGNHISNIILIYYSMLLTAQDTDIKLLSGLTRVRQSAQSQCVCPKEGLMLQISKAQSPDSALFPQKPALTLPLLLAWKKQMKANAENCWLLLASTEVFQVSSLQ